MHKVTFFPLGNADCCLIDLHGGQKILFDCAATPVQERSGHPRIFSSRASAPVV